MILSVTDLPYSENGVAGCVLTVSVTDADGAPYTSLQRQNFEVRLFVDANLEAELARVDVAEYSRAHNLPSVRGLYAIDVLSSSTTWSRPSSNRFFFFIAVHEDTNHGQIVYPIADPSIALGG
jgi:hypothetical protein